MVSHRVPLQTPFRIPHRITKYLSSLLSASLHPTLTTRKTILQSGLSSWPLITATSRSQHGVLSGPPLPAKHPSTRGWTIPAQGCQTKANQHHCCITRATPLHCQSVLTASSIQALALCMPRYHSNNSRLATNALAFHPHSSHQELPSMVSHSQMCRHLARHGRD